LGPPCVFYVNLKKKPRSIFSMAIVIVKLSGTKGHKSCADLIKTKEALETLLKIGTQSLITISF
jgi:hypothetical protein